MSAVGSDPDVPVSELLFKLPIQEMLYELLGASTLPTLLNSVLCSVLCLAALLVSPRHLCMLKPPLMVKIFQKARKGHPRF